MSGIAEIYAQQVFENLKPLHANWEPGYPVKLGDYGVMRDKLFLHLGNIKDLGISYEVRKDDALDDKQFSSKGQAEITFHAKGSVNVNGVVNVKPSVEISFKKEKAVFFNAADCEFSTIENKVSLGQAIMGLQKGVWKKEWAVVTDIVKAGATTLVISGSNASKFVLEASGDVEYINFADASIGLSPSYSSNVSYQIVAKPGIIPLIGLCKIQSLFLFSNKTFQPLSKSMMGSTTLLSTIQDYENIQTDESEEALVFRQLE